MQASFTAAPHQQAVPARAGQPRMILPSCKFIPWSLTLPQGFFTRVPGVAELSTAVTLQQREAVMILLTGQPRMILGRSKFGLWSLTLPPGFFTRVPGVA